MKGSICSWSATIGSDPNHGYFGRPSTPSILSTFHYFHTTAQAGPAIQFFCRYLFIRAALSEPPPQFVPSYLNSLPASLFFTPNFSALPPHPLSYTMRLGALPFPFVLSLFLTIDGALAAPGPRSQPSSRSLHVPILRRAPPQRTHTALGVWAKQQKQFLEAKYGGSSNVKRSSGENLYATFYFTLLAVAYLDQTCRSKPRLEVSCRCTNILDTMA